jgi:GH25 family lysozyme M1 (1,4-beta-N-acetylmuramidase)
LKIIRAGRKGERMPKHSGHFCLRVSNFARVRIAMAMICLVPSTSVMAAEKLQALFSLQELRSLAFPSATLPGAAAPENPPFAVPSDPLSKGGVFGVDTSHWTNECDDPCVCSINWKSGLWAQGIRFAYAEATEGLAWPTDDDAAAQSFLSNWKDLKSLHDSGLIYRGAYHWLSSADNESGKSQAQWFLSQVGPDKDHLPHAVDFEEDFVEVSQDDFNRLGDKAECKTKKDAKGNTLYLCDGWYNRKPQDILNKISDWVAQIDGAGSKAIIYTRSSYWDEKIGPIGLPLLKAHSVWLANYPDPKFPDPGKPQATATPPNKWGMPTAPAGLNYPSGTQYTSQITWQFNANGVFPNMSSVWSCQGGGAPHKNFPELDMSWFPSSMSDFKSAFGLH